MTISSILRQTRDPVDAWAVPQKGKSYIALNLNHFFEILSIKPGGFRVAIHWIAERPRGDVAETGHVDEHFYIAMSWGKSLQINTGEVMVKGDAGGQPVSDLAEALRDVLRAIPFDSQTTEGHANYLGAFPLLNINPGFAIDGIYLEISLGNQLPPPAAQ